MKPLRYSIAILVMTAGTLCCLSSCLNSYLDVSADQGLSEEEVFSNYDNFLAYFQEVYEGSNFNMKCHYPLFYMQNGGKFSTEECTDMCDGARDLERAPDIKLGNGTRATNTILYTTPTQALIPYTYPCVRVANMTILHIDDLQDATPQERDDLLAQAYFVRAFTQFDVFRFCGKLPYIDHVLSGDDEWDLPQDSERDFLMKCADDFQRAADLFEAADMMRRDKNYDLSDSWQYKPNGVTALAMKSRCLLYLASPLFNVEGDESLWKLAADESWKALQAALGNGYALLPASQYTNNWYGVKYTNEQLWGYSTGRPIACDVTAAQCFVPYCFSGSKYSNANCPTQNFVDMFETADGYALNTEEDRARATAAGSYYEQNPFANRDPRFDIDILYNQRQFSGYGNASLYVDENGDIPSGSLVEHFPGASDGQTQTYYIMIKRTGNLSQRGSPTMILTDPIIRLAELYLNYAEAANEWGGPDWRSDGADLSALDAVNVIRNRIGQCNVRSEYTADKDTFRERVKNERVIELCWEGFHYYLDIRRWKDAPERYRTTLYGMRPQKLPAGYDASVYPTGFSYTRFALPARRQILWKNDGMYFLQLSADDLKKMSNYVPYESW